MATKQNHRSHQCLDLDYTNFMSIFDQFDEGVLISDHEGRIVYYNETMGKIDDLSPEFAIGRKVTEVYDVTQETSMVLQCLYRAEAIINVPFFYRTRMGKVVNTIHSMYPLFKNRTLIGAIMFVKDYQLLDKTMSDIRPPQKKVQFNNGTQYMFKDVKGNNPEFSRCINTAKMAASSPSPIMLYGETGTGKELFAQSIHNASIRRKAGYIPVNCSAIPENLLEGILFGTTRGSFTGALDKAGLFEMANGGTLFLDEINSMPIGLQGKILRVLQEKKVRRVGSLKEIDIDAKIISSINIQPHQAIENNTLRADLFYRLGVVFIGIPPLVERKDDIGPLAQFFIEKCSDTLGVQQRRISKKVMDIFLAYHWLGNVRELEHIIEGAMNVAKDSDVIQWRHLHPHFKEMAKDLAAGIKTTSPLTVRSNLDFSGSQPLSGARLDAERVSTVPNITSLPDGHLVMERNMIRQALTKHRGNVTHAANQLGISRQLLHYKMKKYQFDRKAFSSSPSVRN